MPDGNAAPTDSSASTLTLATAPVASVTPAASDSASSQTASATPTADKAEAKPAGTTTAEATAGEPEEGKPTEAKPAEAKPEPVYDFKAPEGVRLQEPVMSEFTAAAKELGVAPEIAQKLVDRVGPKIVEAQRQDAAVAIAQWETDARADKEFGGDNLNANLAVAQKALALADPKMKQLLAESGLGNHPEVIRWMYRVGKSMSEDTLHTGRAPTGDPAKSLYPNSNHN